ncbi:MAG: hypothetical protein D6824_02285 [Planctomycetota bacterium]|nr:MAG: hypothetical protein D6824_02285 [Planctomycetota bacterium]
MRTTLARSSSPLPLSGVPEGARVRLEQTSLDRAAARALMAMGLDATEAFEVRKQGEPTIVTVGGALGRRIGLAGRLASRISVVVQE